MKYSIILTLIYCVFCKFLFADKLNDQDTAQIKIIALGSIVNKQYAKPVVKGKEHSDIELPEGGTLEMREEVVGESPPASLHYSAKLEAADYTRVRVGFNNPSSIHHVEPNKMHMLYRRQKEIFHPYVRIPSLKKGSQTLVLLTKEKTKKDWLSQPQVTLVSLNTTESIGKNLYLLNVSSELLKLKLGNEDVVHIKSNGGKYYQVSNEATPVPLHVTANDLGGKHYTVLNTGIRVPDKHMTVFVFYDSPGKNSRKTVGVCRIVTALQGEGM